MGIPLRKKSRAELLKKKCLWNGLEIMTRVMAGCGDFGEK